MRALITLVMAVLVGVAYGADLNHPAEWHPEYQAKEQWARRAKELREQVLVAAGLWPMPAKGDMRPVIHGRIEREGYTVEKVFFESLPGFYVTGSLYRPEETRPARGAAKRRAAVLTPYGHWPDGRFNREKDPQKKIDGGGERTIEGATYPLQARCAMLARMGCVVFQYDMVGYADSVQIPNHKEGFTDVEAMLRLQSTLGLQLWDSIRALDFLESLPDVDPKRIGVTGASGGATQTLLLSVVDDRPAAVFPAVMISENMQGGCVCENAPYLRIGTNNAELAATIAPRPLGMSAANDWTHDLETRGFPEIRSIYELFGAGDRVEAKHFPFEHNYNVLAREMMYEFMNRHLKLGIEGPIREKPFVPVPVEELSVWDERHPKPKADGVKIVKEWWTREAERQMRELREHPEEYRKVVGTALRVMMGQPAQGLRSVAVSWVGRATAITVRAVPKGSHGGGAVGVIRVEMPEAGVAPDPKYAGLTYGYERTLVAERASRLVDTVVAAHNIPGVTSVSLEAKGRYGVAGLVAAGVLGNLGQSRIDVDGFDFVNVHDPADENFLPGALRYGGVEGLRAMCH